MTKKTSNSHRVMKSVIRKSYSSPQLAIAVIATVAMVGSIVLYKSHAATNTITVVGGHVGYIGCSNTWMTVDGYHHDGGQRMWPALSNYSSGTIAIWGSNLTSSYWTTFKSTLAHFPDTKTVWIQFCMHPTETDATNYTAAVTVINQVKALIPGATIYVSSLNGYVAPHVCSGCGVDGPSRGTALAQQMVSEGRASLGPDMASQQLLSIYQTPSSGATSTNNQTQSDGCHPNTSSGRAFLGKTLLSFFN